MNTVLLIFLSLFATIGVTYVIDTIRRLCLYNKYSISDIDITIKVKGDNELLYEMMEMLCLEILHYGTANGCSRIHIIDDGLSKLNQENMDLFANNHKNIFFIRRQ